MNNICAYIVGVLMVVLACIPPINFIIIAPGEYFPFLMALAGFAAFFLLFIKTRLIIKALAIMGFVNCFFSAAPLVSFVAFISLMAVFYFFVLCEHIKNYDPIWKMLKCLLLLHLFFFLMQAIRHDVLFNYSERICFGIVGQHMQSASFSVILAATLLPTLPQAIGFPFIISIICNSAGAFISAVVGAVSLVSNRWNAKVVVEWLIFGFLVFMLWMIIGGKLAENMNMGGGRLGVWASTLKLAGQRWFLGWGIGTYKVIFPALGGIETIPWKTTHNCWIQIFFETGIIGFTLISGYCLYLVLNLIQLTKRAIFKSKAIACLSGLAMIGVNMMIHFPTRQIQCVLLIIFFISYVQKVVDNGSKQT